MNDNFLYARLVKFIGNKGFHRHLIFPASRHMSFICSPFLSGLTEEKLPELEEITMDAAQARSIFEASNISMGSFFLSLLILCCSWLTKCGR